MSNHSNASYLVMAGGGCINEVEPVPYQVNWLNLRMSFRSPGAMSAPGIIQFVPLPRDL